MKFVPLTFVASILCQKGPEAETKFFGKDDIFNPKTAAKKIATFFAPALVPVGLRALKFVPSKPKIPPGRIPSASIDEVWTNFVNANIPTCPTEKIGGKDCICRETYPYYEYIEDKDARTVVVVAINRKLNQIVVAYRITGSIQNWIDNLSILFTDAIDMPEGVRVFRGIYNDFMTSYYRVKDSVVALLDKPEYKNHTLLITGYSLGGAISQISTPSWYNLLKQRNDPRRMEVIAYASPRVGNKAFADLLESFNIPITRYTNENDLVSHLPGRKGGYVHVGAEVYGQTINGQHVLRYCNQEYDEDPTCVMSTFVKRSARAHLVPLGKFVRLPPYC